MATELSLSATAEASGSLRAGCHTRIWYVAIISHLEEYASIALSFANPARGELNRESEFSLSPFTPDKLFFRDMCGRRVRRHPTHSLHSG